MRFFLVSSVKKKVEEKGYFLQVPCVLLETYRTQFTPLAHLTLLRFLSHYMTWERDQATYRGSYRDLSRALDIPCSTLTGTVRQWERAGIAQVSDDGLLTITVSLDPPLAAKCELSPAESATISLPGQRTPHG